MYFIELQIIASISYCSLFGKSL